MFLLIIKIYCYKYFNDIKHRKRLVDSFVNSIILHDDKIEFYFNFKEGSETLTLTELEKCSDTLGSLPPTKNALLSTDKGAFFE